VVSNQLLKHIKDL